MPARSPDSKRRPGRGLPAWNWGRFVGVLLLLTGCTAESSERESPPSQRPSVQQIDGTVRFRPPTPKPEAQFGRAVALSGSHALVGAHQEDQNTDEAIGTSDAGAAYLYRRTPDGSWLGVKTLRADSARTFDFFGSSVALDSSWALVGAPGVDGTEGRNDVGAAYVFGRTSGGWSRDDILRACGPDAQQNTKDFFAESIALSGDAHGGQVAAVGAPGENGPAEQMEDTGAVYVFEHVAQGHWRCVQLLRAADGNAEDRFGASVAMSGPYLLVGAPWKEHPSGENHSPSARGSSSEESKDPSSRTLAGAAYLFKRGADGTWRQIESLRPPSPMGGHHFGISVAVNRTRALVGALGQQGRSAVGAAHLFERQAESWEQETVLQAPRSVRGGHFGASVALGARQALVGAPLEDEPHGGGRRAGAAYRFERTRSGWKASTTLRSPRPKSGDEFGVSVALNRGRGLVGAHLRDRSAEGAVDSGAAFLFGWGDSEQTETANR